MLTSGISDDVRFVFYLFCVCSLIDGANKLHFTQNKLYFLRLLLCSTHSVFYINMYNRILNTFLYVFPPLPFPPFTQIYANYVRIGVQRVSLKCQLFIEGTRAVCVLILCCAKLPENRKTENQNPKI